MAEPEFIPTNPNGNERQPEPGRNLAVVVYILQALSFFLGGITGLVGVIVNYVKLQDEAQAAGGECLIFLADLHAISMPHKPAVLHAATLEMVATLVACGVDPAKAILFNQAQVPAHAEMQWLLNGTARMGWLNRMTQWKDKAGKNREGASAALFTYPVLQAADVLLYQATHVPVGEDQKQHLELARDIAQKFNNDFATEDAPVFTLPDPYIPEDAARIMSLRDGTKKMSKSDPSDMSRINLTDDADTIAKKIHAAKNFALTICHVPIGIASNDSHVPSRRSSAINRIVIAGQSSRSNQDPISNTGRMVAIAPESST